MTEKERTDYLFWEKAHEERKAMFEALSDSEIAEKFDYYWLNSQFHRKYTDKNHCDEHCTYDAALLRLLLPELIKRYKRFCSTEVKS